MNLKSILLGAALGLSALPAFAEIVIEQAYARSASPAARSGAVFMVVENTGPEADRLIAVATGAAKHASLHTNIIEDGVAKMLPVPEGFPIAAGETLLLQRGGNHVMLMGLTAPFVQGQSLSLTLTFARAGEITLVVPIDNARDTDMQMGGGAGSMAGMSDN